MNLTVTQALVDRIIARAKNSNYGLSEGLSHKLGHLQIRQYSPPNLDSLAMLLVNGYRDKYDLISVFSAAFQEIEAELAVQGAGTPSPEVAAALVRVAEGAGQSEDLATLAAEVRSLRNVIGAVLAENLGLADGEVCTLIRLKRALGSGSPAGN